MRKSTNRGMFWTAILSLTICITRNHEKKHESHLPLSYLLRQKCHNDSKVKKWYNKQTEGTVLHFCFFPEADNRHTNSLCYQTFFFT